MLSEKSLSRIRELKLSPHDFLVVCTIVHDAMIESAGPKQTKLVALEIPADWPADYQIQFWAAYPNKTAKPRAMKALDKVAFGGKTRWNDLMAGLERYIISPKVISGYVKGPEKWIHDEGWNDQPIDGPRRNLTFFEIAAGMRE